MLFLFRTNLIVLPNYESCGWSASQMQTFLNNNASVIPTRVIAPET